MFPYPLGTMEGRVRYRGHCPAGRCKSDVSGYRLFDLFSSYQTGIHFGGKVIDNTILNFDDLSYTEQSQQEQDDVGLVSGNVTDGTTRKVVIPMMRVKRRKEESQEAD